ncbi:hypothetical protein GCM10010168_18830 [Actinoplanes ianthinogenes]|uniref:STAS domain-containing protein n=1 Tax=Actinoplanes ianthinogenes TaxID=122358 RepID=A0ABN6CQW1_9ACTN|nr:MEDS domain-containing protein [Actinoplanes ianthinogenes]BCJ47525.1 hypothetical protein Aiant_81820 [Actinoplanes ianthinogenes]GGR02366.1 hypothetical protein GCM10010168_18830 [Actinoplanes ianthinogenes]
MRLAGVIGTPDDAGVHDHVGWAFDQPADFHTRAGRFLSAGLARRQRVVYVAGTDGAGPAGMHGLEAALATGQAQLTSVTAMYSDGEPVDPDRQVAAFAAAAGQALTDGWSGLRVAADVTSLVRTEQQRAAWARYEFLIDRHIARHPLIGMCGFQRGALDPAVLAEVTCVHPALSAGCSGFRLYAAGDPDTHAVLAGEIDRASGDLFATALRHARPEPADGRLVIDAAELAFVDHHSLAALADYATGLGVTAVMHADRDSVAAAIARIVPMAGLRVVVKA